MLSSMTGFSRVQKSSARLTLALELRSLNHRHLEMVIKLPEGLRFFEPRAREAFKEKLIRGRVEALFSPESAALGEDSLDEEALLTLGRAMAQVRAMRSHLGEVTEPTVLEVLRWPGVVRTQGGEEKWEPLLEAALAEGLEGLLQARAREGQALAEGLLARAQAFSGLAERVRTLVPQVLNRYEEKLRARLLAVASSMETGRIEEELAFFMARMDISEEIERIEAHLGEFFQLLQTGGAVGKKLDFLLQELGREANTLAAKAVGAELGSVAVEMRVLVEAMREQVQNIE